jgi:NADH-quinone oxidoreductase subunit L
LFLAFFGEYRGHAHPHESPLVMTLPLAALAVLSLAGGYINVPRWLEPMFPAIEEVHQPWLAYVSVAAGLAGIALAYLFYIARPSLADSVAGRLGPLYRLVYGKYFVDEIYDGAVVRPIVAGSRTVLWRGVDVGLIDGTVDGVGAWSRGLGSALRLIQSGNIRSYAAWVVWGSLVAILAMVYFGVVR